MKKLSSLATTLALSLGLAACSGGSIDGRYDSFGGKTDSEYSPCQLSEVLNYANESATTVARLNRAGLNTEVGSRIVAHRAGPDGDIGTADDDIYDDLDELDAVDFVGPVALDHLVAAILKRCEVDLATRPFINAKTFEGFTGGGFNRDSVELEAAMTVSGVSGQQLQAILISEDRRGRTIFSRIAKARIMEAFSYSYAIDEMPWDSKSHQAREGLANLPLSIESGRYVPDEEGGERELDLGTDIMDDVYYDTFDYRLTRSEQLLRSRVRWDTADVVRRLLIAAKFGAFVDDNGLKRASKVDVRTDSGTHKDTIEHDIMTGKVPWSGGLAALEPVKEIYTRLNDNNQLPDIGTERDVLVLDPKTHLRSTRSRFHLDLVQLSTMRSFYNNGKQRVRDLRDLAQKAIDDGIVSGQELTDTQALIDMANGIDSGELIAERAKSALEALDPGASTAVADLQFPDQLASSASSILQLEKNRVVAEAIDAVYHDLANAADDIDRDITGTAGLDYDEFALMFIEWRKSLSSSLLIKRTPHSFLAAFKTIEEAADRQAQLDAFNAYGEAEQAADNDDFEDFEPINDEIFAAVGAHLEFETNKINQRQVEAAGSMALGLWFDQARETYVPASNRAWGNFIIDTMDMAEMLTREEWISIPEDERKIDMPFDPAKVFHTVLVNEVQIELGNEAPYLKRVDELQAKVDDGSATDDELKALKGAQFVLGEMSDSLIYLSDIKKDKVLDRLDDNGAPRDIEWVPSEASKGTISLRRLGDMD